MELWNGEDDLLHALQQRIPLRRSESLRSKARLALETCTQAPVDIEQWARQLAEDVSSATD